MLSKEARINYNEVPKGWSLDAANFANKLLKRKPQERLGTYGPSEVKNHPWLSNINWKKLERKELSPPFAPNVS